MKKRIISVIMTIVMILPVAANFAVNSTAEELSGKCGDNLTWKLDIRAEEMTISGTGDMWNFAPGEPSNFDNTWYKKVIIKPGVTSIGDYAFSNNTTILGVVIPSTVKRIGTNAFSDCSMMTGSVTIPEGVTKIEDYAFSSCGRLEQVTLPQSLVSIGKSAFSSNAFTTINIPQSVKKIDDFAFAYAKITSLNIPKNVEQIGKGIIDDCDDLKSITVDKNNKFYDSRNNCNAIINSSTNELIGGCINTTIPNTVTSIGDFAISYEGLTELIIPDGVISIGEYAIRSETLKKITLPESIKVLKSGCFYCYMLKDILFKGTREQWNNVEKVDAQFDNMNIFCKDEKVFRTVNYYTPFAKEEIVEAGTYITIPYVKARYTPILGWNDDQYSTTIKYKTGDKVLITNDITFYPIYSYSYGDANGDGKKNSTDALMILKHSVGLETLSEKGALSCDVNFDSEVNSSDALIVLQYSVGIIREFVPSTPV